MGRKKAGGRGLLLLSLRDCEKNLGSFPSEEMPGLGETQVASCLGGRAHLTEDPGAAILLETHTHRNAAAGVVCVPGRGRGGMVEESLKCIDVACGINNQNRSRFGEARRE